MIDFDRFWHEPGCKPGLSKEETEQQQAAGMAMFMQMRERPHAEHPLDPAGMPPEAAAVFEALEEKMRAAEQQARDSLASIPLSPEIQRLLRKISDPDAAESSGSES